MSDPTAPFPKRAADVDAESARWLARFDAGLSSADQAAFENWRTAHPDHDAAWTRLSGTWSTFDRPYAAGLAHRMIADLHQRRRHRARRRMVIGSASLLAAAAIAVIFGRPALRLQTPPGAELVSAVLRPSTKTLPDGSTVEFDAGALVVEEFTPTRRLVRLTRGEAHFAVKKDTARPFVVVANGVAVQAVGTAFAVKLGAEAIDVVVTEGRVQVARPARPPDVTATASVSTETALPAVSLQAGERVSVSLTANPSAPLAPEKISSEEIARRLAWRGPRIELTGTTLADAVAILNRENRLQIAIGDSRVRVLRLHGTFRADDAEGFVHLLEMHYGIRTTWRGPATVTLFSAP